MSAFARRLLTALISLVFIGVTGFAGILTGVQYAPVKTVIATTTTEAKIEAAATTVPVDPWKSIRRCDLAYARVQIARVDYNGDYPESYEGSGYSEVWKLFVFGKRESLDSFDSDRLNDRWGNPISDITADATLDDIPESAMTVWIYNQFGFLAGRDAGKGLEVSGFCHEVKGDVAWTESSRLTRLGEYSFDYPPMFVTDYQNPNFTVEVFTGKKLNGLELHILDFQIRGIDKGTHWAGLGFIGPSSSTHGMFTVNNFGLLKWEFGWDDPHYDISESAGMNLPLDTEIIMKTSYASGEIVLQRFVLHPGFYDHPDMIEPFDQPLYTLP